MAGRIVLGTANPTKREKLRWLLQGLPLQPVEEPAIDVPETGATFAENASLKAMAYSHDGLAIASDGGLEIPSLAGVWDPLETGRRGPEELSWLARELPDGRVRWREAVALAEAGRLLAVWEAAETRAALPAHR